MKTILTTTLLMLSFNLGFAQNFGGGQPPNGPPPENQGASGAPPVLSQEQIDELVNDLESELLLSFEQKEEILSLYTEYYAQMENSNTGNNRRPPSRDDISNDDKDNLKPIELKVKDLLEEDQYELYDNYLEEHKPDKEKDNETRQQRRN